MTKNNRDNTVRELNEFIESDSEKVILLKGTHQYEKHSLVLKIISESNQFNVGLYRSNSLQNVADQLRQAKYNVKINHKFSSGKRYNLSGVTFYFDSLFTKSTWRNSPQELDFALIYPMDSFCEKKEPVKKEFISDILNHRSIRKIFIVTWTDIRHDYDWLQPFVDRTIVFDAEEENPEYHKRVLN